MDLACRWINNRDPLARVVHERLFAGDMMLAHHRAQPSLEPAKQIAEPAVAVTLLVDLPIFLPKDHHRHAGPLQLARQGRPIRLDPTPLAGLPSGSPEQPQPQGVAGQLARPGPRHSRRCRPFQIVLDRRPRHAQTSPDLARARPAMVKSQQMSQLSHAQFPLRRHPHLLVDHRRAGSASVADSRGADAKRLTGSGGRLQIGIGGRIASEFAVNVRQADTGFWKSSLETSIYLSNRPVVAKIAADAIRKHWGIENKSHYTRDVTFREDASRIRTNPGIFARLRTITYNVLRCSQSETMPQDRFAAALGGLDTVLAMVFSRALNSPGRNLKMKLIS